MSADAVAVSDPAEAFDQLVAAGGVPVVFRLNGRCSIGWEDLPPPFGPLRKFVAAHAEEVLARRGVRQPEDGEEFRLDGIGAGSGGTASAEAGAAVGEGGEGTPAPAEGTSATAAEGAGPCAEAVMPADGAASSDRAPAETGDPADGAGVPAVSDEAPAGPPPLAARLLRALDERAPLARTEEERARQGLAAALAARLLDLEADGAQDADIAAAAEDLLRRTGAEGLAFLAAGASERTARAGVAERDGAAVVTLPTVLDPLAAPLVRAALLHCAGAGARLPVEVWFAAEGRGLRCGDAFRVPGAEAARAALAGVPLLPGPPAGPAGDGVDTGRAALPEAGLGAPAASPTMQARPPAPVPAPARGGPRVRWADPVGVASPARLPASPPLAPAGGPGAAGVASGAPPTAAAPPGSSGGPPGPSAAEPPAATPPPPVVAPPPWPRVAVAPAAPDPVLVADAEAFRRVLAATEAEPVVGLDTETTGLDPHRHRIRTVQVATGTAVWVIDAWAAGDVGPLRDWLAARAAAGRRTLLHNAKFDLSMLRAALGGAPLDPVAVCDPMLWSQLLACGLPVEGGHGLAAVARRWIGVDLPKEERSGAWDKALRPEQVVYAGRDAWVLVPLAEALWNGAGGHRGIADEGLARVAALEDACVPAVADLEYDGIAFDLPYWAGLTEEMRAEAVSARAEALAGLAPGLPRRAARISMFGEAEGPALNPDSPAQVLEALRGLGLEVAGTAEDVLKPLAGAHRAVAALLRYKRASKLLSAFGEALPRHVHPVTGRIHARYQQICANGVGRFSASAPNLQQVPSDKKFRRGFVVPEGRALIVADYSMVELRLAAGVAGDTRMLDIFNRRAAAAGEEERVRWDLHRQTAALMLGKDAGEVTKAERALGKPTNFGLIYSLGASGLADYARNGYGVEMTLEEATAYKARFFEAYRGIAAWHRRERARIEAAIRAGDWAAVCARTITGRRRRFPWRAFEDVRIGEVYNTPVQGAGADLLKRAMARIRPYAVRNGWALVNTIHDELVFEVPVEDAEATAARVKSEMEAAGEDLGLKVPIEAEVSVGMAWSDKT